MNHSYSTSSHTAGTDLLMSIDLSSTLNSENGTTECVNHDNPESHFLETQQITEIDEPTRPEFKAQKCLFCQLESHDFDSNISHMAKSHGFIVPDQHRLQVDLESFCNYLDLIISGYAECLYCGSQRNNSHAARHHMLAKDHCRIDNTREDSEYREFYDWDTYDEETMAFVQLDETTRRLPSGKILSNRSVRAKVHHSGRPIETADAALKLPDVSDIWDGKKLPSGLSPDQSIAQLSPAERRQHAFVGQLTRLRKSDRMSLAHMPFSQQRAQLLAQQKQANQARRSQQFYEGRLKEKGNKTLMKHYVPDTPGRTNG